MKLKVIALIMMLAAMSSALQARDITPQRTQKP